MKYTKKKKYQDKENEFQYMIKDILGTLSENEKSGWGKYICTAKMGEDHDSIDIRNLKKDPDGEEEIKVGKGICLNPDEVDKLTDILVNKGYGTTQVLEEQVRIRKARYGIVDYSENNEDDE